MSDLISAFQNEVFRPLVTLVMPGWIAILPYRFAFAEDLAKHGITAPSTSIWSIIFIFAAGVFVGLLLDVVGSYVEDDWDQVKGDKHIENWFEYLRGTFEKEVGHRYLRNLVLRLKFEMNTYLALLVGLPGAAMLIESHHPGITSYVVAFATLLLAWNLRRFAQESHDSLSVLRAEMLGTDHGLPEEVRIPPRLRSFLLLLVIPCALLLACGVMGFSSGDILCGIFHNRIVDWIAPPNPRWRAYFVGAAALFLFLAVRHVLVVPSVSGRISRGKQWVVQWPIWQALGLHG